MENGLLFLFAKEGKKILQKNPKAIGKDFPEKTGSSAEIPPPRDRVKYRNISKSKRAFFIPLITSDNDINCQCSLGTTSCMQLPNAEQKKFLGIFLTMVALQDVEKILQ